MTYISLDHTNGQCYFHTLIGLLVGGKSNPFVLQGTSLSSKNWNLVVFFVIIISGFLYVVVIIIVTIIITIIY